MKILFIAEDMQTNGATTALVLEKREWHRVRNTADDLYKIGA